MPPAPPPPAVSPDEVFTDFFSSVDQLTPEHKKLREQHEKLQAEHAALQAEHTALLAARVQAPHGQLALVRSLVEPLTRLERLTTLEEKRCSRAGGEESAALCSALTSTVSRFHSALAEHGIEAVAPEAGAALDAHVHEVATKLGKARSVPSITDATLLVSSCHLQGLVHTQSGAVLRRALVVPKAAETTVAVAATVDAADAAAQSTAERVHELRKGDTLQGIALRYGVSPSAISKLNKLPAGSASAVHLRTRLLIPPVAPPRPTPATPSTPAALAAAETAGADARAWREAAEADEIQCEDDDDDESDVDEDVPLRLASARRAGSGADGLYNQLVSMMR